MDMMQFAYYLGYLDQANSLDTYEMKTFHNMHGAFSCCNLFLHSTKSQCMCNCIIEGHGLYKGT